MSNENESALVAVKVECSSNKLMELLESVTPADLHGLRELIADHKQKLRAWEKLEKIIATSLGEEPKVPAKKSHKTAADPTVSTETALTTKRKRIALFLHKRRHANGHEIVTNCGIQPAKLAETMNCEFFLQSSQGWSLTPAGTHAFVG